MKKLFEYLSYGVMTLLILPVVLAWVPGAEGLLAGGPGAVFGSGMWASFRQLSLTLLATTSVALVLTVALSYLSILVPALGKITAGVLETIESVPSILVALFAYAPVAAVLAKNASESSAILSVGVFVFAATLTSLPEAVRGLTLPLGELYHRKYSVSFRAYGFTKARILWVLLNSRIILDVLRRTGAAILARTLVLDTSFGFIIQIGMGSYGTPAHTSPGALIAANRDAIFSSPGQGRTPEMFWIPVILLFAISLGFLLLLSKRTKEQS